MHEKLLKLNLDLKYDIVSGKICLDGNPTTNGYIMSCSWFNELMEKGKTKAETFKELKELLMSDFSFNLKDERDKEKQLQKEKKEKEKLEKESQKQQEKEEKQRKKEEQELEKQRKKAEKEAQKQQEKEEKEQKKAEKEAQAQKEKEEKLLRATEIDSDDEEYEKASEYALSHGRIPLDYQFEGKDGWKNYLTYTPKPYETPYGTILIRSTNPDSTLENYTIYFKESPRYKGHLWWNEFKRRPYIKECPLEEIDIRRMPLHSELDMGIKSRPDINDAYYIAAHDNKKHPLQDYLLKMRELWDGVERIPTLFCTLLKADDTPLIRMMTELWFLGAVKRIFKPGSKNEVMIILVGEQGDGKNTIWEKLFEQWGIELNINVNSKEQEYGQKLDFCWCVVVDELANFSKSDAERYKQWLSIKVDNFRSPYDRTVEEHPRHNCYCGSTNTQYFLKDYTDFCERRYWPILCHGTKAESWVMIEKLTPEFIDQIWAEAAYKYFKNPDIAIDLRGELVADLTEHQKQFKTSKDENIAEMLEEVLDRYYFLDENGQFKDDADMILQMKNRDMRTITPDEHIGKINAIPSRQIRIILKEIIHDVRKHDYFKYELQDKWLVNVQDHKLNTKVYRRINPILSQDEIQMQRDNELVEKLTSLNLPK